jgi:hypothetical protein
MWDKILAALDPNAGTHCHNHRTSNRTQTKQIPTSRASAVMQHQSLTIAAVFGWAEPEPQLANRTSIDGHFVICDAAPNLRYVAYARTELESKRMRERQTDQNY